MTKLGVFRLGTASLVALAIVAGIFGELRYGALCSLEVWIMSVTDPVVGPVLRTLGLWRVPISAICPLGYVERSLASGELLPQWPSVLLIVLSVLVLGRVFCAWICPTVFLRRLFGIKSGSTSKGGVKPKSEAVPTAAPKAAATSKGANWGPYSSYAFLGGVLLASFLFRFPVFCFFCPIGIFFGFLYALARVLTPDSLGLELVLFPLMLGLELRVLKSWCRSICPLGALLSIVGSFNRFFLPTIKKDKCLQSKGVNCRVCERACPEGIELSSIGKGLAPNSCTKCLECYAKCPSKAVEIAILR